MTHLTSRRLAGLFAAGAVGTGLVLVAAASAGPVEPDVRVVTGAGDIAPAVTRFRRALGPDNGGGAGGDPGGRREIDWDAVPDRLAAPNALPGDYFNAPRGPRARGAVLTTPGRHVAVSADAANPAGAAPRFANIDPSYAAEFRTFSAERLFSPIGSNVVNLRFRVPGTRRPAAVRGFGAVYTGIDRAENTAFAFYGRRGELLRRVAVPRSRGGLSFLGVAFAEPVVARVRIEYGNRALGRAERGRDDVAVMDDFIYGEPVGLR